MLYCTRTDGGELEELGGAGMALIDVVVDGLAKGGAAPKRDGDVIMQAHSLHEW